jgi:hypothetical protein
MKEIEGKRGTGRDGGLGSRPFPWNGAMCGAQKHVGQ